MLDPHILWPNVIEGAIIGVCILVGIVWHGEQIKQAARIDRCLCTCACNKK